MLTVVRRTYTDEMCRNDFYCKKANKNHLFLLAHLSAAKTDPSSNPDRAPREGGGGMLFTKAYNSSLSVKISKNVKNTKNINMWKICIFWRTESKVYSVDDVNFFESLVLFIFALLLSVHRLQVQQMSRYVHNYPKSLTLHILVHVVIQCNFKFRVQHILYCTGTILISFRWSTVHVSSFCCRNVLFYRLGECLSCSSLLSRFYGSIL